MEIFRAILIETRTVCNRTCWFCKFGQERQDEKILQMEWDTILRILRNLKDLDYSGRISWYNINEPLSDRRMLRIIKETREHCPRAFISFATNGDLLTADLYRSLKENGLDALGISVYDDRTLQRMLPLADSQMILMDMRRAEPGLLENRGGNIQQHGPAFQRDRARFADRSCERPFSMMVVNPEGKVVLCCADMYSDVVMGSVAEQRLEVIWESPQFQEYRNTLKEEGRRNLRLCSDCSYSGRGFRPFFPYAGNRKGRGVIDIVRSRLRFSRTTVDG